MKAPGNHLAAKPNHGDSIFWLLNLLGMLFTLLTTALGTKVSHDEYLKSLGHFDFEVKTGIHRTAADLATFRMENWYIPMIILLSYPTLAIFIIHIPFLLKSNATWRLVLFVIHMFIVLFAFQLILTTI